MIDSLRMKDHIDLKRVVLSIYDIAEKYNLNYEHNWKDDFVTLSKGTNAIRITYLMVCCIRNENLERMIVSKLL